MWLSKGVSLTFCFSLAFAQNSSTDYAARNLATIQEVYRHTVYPLNIALIQAEGQNVPGLFNQAATGRISPVGNFTGFLDSIEYFFALAPAPSSNPEGLGIFDAEVVSFTSGCPEVASSVVYLKAGPVNNATGGLLPGSEDKVTILKQVAFWRFDDEGAVKYYEAWIPNLESWITTSTGFDQTNPLIQEGLIAASLCPAIQDHCTGANEQYSGTVDCVAQLTLKTFGNYDEAWGDNVVCRQIHAQLTQFRPDVHCPHVGPTGGGKCVDIDYRVEYFDDAQLLGSTNTFMCPSQV